MNKNSLEKKMKIINTNQKEKRTWNLTLWNTSGCLLSQKKK